MMLAHPLQRKQLQLFWERFPPRLGFCLWEYFTILTEAHLLGQTLIKAWLAVSTLIHPTSFVLRSGLCAGQSGSSTPNFKLCTVQSDKYRSPGNQAPQSP